MPGLVLFELVRKRGPGSDQRHVPPQHVPQLRQFVEARLSKHASDRRDPWIVGEFEESVLAGLVDLAARLDEPTDKLVMDPVISARIHRSKLEHREWLHHVPDSHLPEKDRVVRRQLQQDDDQQEESRKHQQECQTADDIQPPFDRVVDRPPLPARASLRVKERIHTPKSHLSCKLWLGIDMESNRKLVDRFRAQPVGELSTDSSLESFESSPTGWAGKRATSFRVDSKSIPSQSMKE